MHVIEKNNPRKVKLQKQKSHIKCYKKNPKKFIEASTRWKKENPEKVRETQKRSNKKRILNPQYRLSKRMRNGIGKSLKGNKNNNRWEKLVNYDVKQLKKHLESTMPDGYSWNDFLSGNLHIDHIIPISAFNFSDIEHIDFMRCWNLDNLQLLPAKENLIKSNKLEQSFQPSLAI